MTGEVSILSVGGGDVKLVFDPDNPQDSIRAARIVTDMLRRGYALLVDTGKKRKGHAVYQRVIEFDATKYEYIIADMDPLVAHAADAQDEVEHEPQDAQGEEAGAAPSPQSSETPPPARRGRRRRIPATGARAVAISRTAGG